MDCNKNGRHDMIFNRFTICCLQVKYLLDLTVDMFFTQTVLFCSLKLKQGS